MDPVIDTIFNIMVFVFIGLMIWLYFRKETEDGCGRSGADASRTTDEG